MIEKKYWRRDWNEADAKTIDEAASYYLRLGAINKRAAWDRAELDVWNRLPPFMRGKNGSKNR